MTSSNAYGSALTYVGSRSTQNDNLSPFGTDLYKVGNTIYHEGLYLVLG